jgi:hypothetical protein
MSYGHAEWIGEFSLGHRVWEAAATFVTGETADIIGRPERPELALVPLALCVAGLVPAALRSNRHERRAVAVPLSVGVAAIVIPIALAIAASSKDYVLARNLIPALVPLLVAVGIGLTVPAARRVGSAIAAGLLAYSLAFCVWVSFDPDLQRPDWNVVAERLGEPQAPRATVTWALGEAPLRYYLSSGAIQVKPSEGYDWLVHEVDFVSDGPAPPPSPRLLGSAFHQTTYEDTGRLSIRRYRIRGPGLAPLRLRTVRHTQLNFRNNGVLLDGVGPG